MKKYNEAEEYTKSFVEYQNKIYIPGFYVGGKIDPALKAKTKAGGYWMLVLGIVLLCFYLFKLISNFSVDNLGLVVPIIFAILLIVVGIKFIRLNSRTK